MQQASNRHNGEEDENFILCYGYTREQKDVRQSWQETLQSDDAKSLKQGPILKAERHCKYK